MRITTSWDGVPLGVEAWTELGFEVRDEELAIRFDAPFYADPAPPLPAGSTPGLWEYEVVEVFLVGEAGRYLELEFGPAGHYLALTLSGYRQVERSDHALDYVAQIGVGGRWQGSARAPLSLLPRGIRAANAYHIHGPPDARVYAAAVPVPGAQPDFHRTELFAAWQLPERSREGSSG